MKNQTKSRKTNGKIYRYVNINGPCDKKDATHVEIITYPFNKRTVKTIPLDEFEKSQTEQH